MELVMLYSGVLSPDDGPTGTRVGATVCCAYIAPAMSIPRMVFFMARLISKRRSSRWSREYGCDNSCSSETAETADCGIEPEPDRRCQSGRRWARRYGTPDTS